MKLILQAPVAPLHINQVFGVDKKTYSQFGLDGHNGLDLRAYHGQPVYASHDGLANYEIDSSQGHGVDVQATEKCDEGFYAKTRYWHLCDPKREPKQYKSPIYEKKNIKVKAGDVIGYADNTGFSTGDHLHFGLKPQGLNSRGKYYNLYPDNGYLGATDPQPFLKETMDKFEPGAESYRIKIFQSILQDTGFFPKKTKVTEFWGPITTQSYDKFKAATGFLLTVDNGSTGGEAGPYLPSMKSLISSKTFWVNFATFAAGVLTLFSDSFGAYLSPEVTGGVLTALGAVNVFLRLYTTKEITSVV